MSYNLFLDDVRLPFVDPKRLVGDPQPEMTSAYYYTNYTPFKNERWTIARNYNEFVKIVSINGVPKLVAFDHDLGNEHYQGVGRVIDYTKFTEKTGYDCAKWLCDYCQEHKVPFPKYVIHSMNTIGKINISSYIENYKKHVENDDQGTI